MAKTFLVIIDSQTPGCTRDEVLLEADFFEVESNGSLSLMCFDEIVEPRHVAIFKKWRYCIEKDKIK